MVFSRNLVESEWKRGKHVLSRVSNYVYMLILLSITYVMGPGMHMSKRYAISVRRKLISYIYSLRGSKELFF